MDPRNHLTDALQDRLIVYAVYWNPSDFPGWWVVRRHFIEDLQPVPENQIHAMAKDLETLHWSLRRCGLYRMDRDIWDDPAIREVWV